MTTSGTEKELPPRSHPDYWKAYKAKNRERLQEYERARYQRRKEWQKAQAAQWRKDNPEKAAELSRKSQKKRRAYYTAKQRERTAAKLQRTMPWANQFYLEEFYDAAKMRSELTGVAYHVDHIVPLQGKQVSGLHVPENLQIITASENLSKSNRYEDAQCR